MCYYIRVWYTIQTSIVDILNATVCRLSSNVYYDSMKVYTVVTSVCNQQNINSYKTQHNYPVLMGLLLIQFTKIISFPSEIRMHWMESIQLFFMGGKVYADIVLESIALYIQVRYNTSLSLKVLGTFQNCYKK